MNLVELITSHYPSIREEYLKECEEWVEDYQAERKENLQEHEWWKEYIIAEERNNIEPPLSKKYWILTDLVMSLFDNFSTNKFLIESLFSLVENYAKTLVDEEEVGMLEIFFFETIINRFSWYPDLLEKFYSVLGEKSLSICEKNNERWRKIGKSLSEKKE